ncbi:hypothetical protein F5884DRAFT_494832 [Xylogone sp. PMI_703]|nr:hypothetical protein F5884DRAFT_494832 [Xylogone sp. PMI_703]
MTSAQSRRYWLLSYPRTASNLLVRMLALDDQQDFLASENGGYSFIPTVPARFRLFKISGRPIEAWTQEQRADLMERFQRSFDNLQKHVAEAESQGKGVYIKEHVSWMMEPVAETKWVFGEDSTQELPWTLNVLSRQTRSPLNHTVLPDDYLLTWRPTFLIRHPALVFPSNYRTVLDNEGPEVVRTEIRQQALELTMHWSRTLYDWYRQNLSKADSMTSNSEFSWPVILDADDIILHPEIVHKYCEIIGLDPSKIKTAWEPASKEELDKMFGPERRMRSTISASTGIIQGKAATNLDIEEESRKWKAEFGGEEGEKLLRWVKAAMPDYEYMKAKRLMS